MNAEERLAALERRGFTRRQAALLAMVLLNSGCFLRRQHAAFFSVEDGSCTTDFVRGLVQRGLATRQVFDRQTQVFRLCSRALYDAVGEPHSRLQRAAEPDAITHRLMTLDVLIACREMPYVATEAEKVSLFTRLLRVPETDLPRRIYRSESPDVPATTRYFVDRVPVLLGADVTMFVYVLGWAPLGAFASFLNAYAPLLRHLPRPAIRFCAVDERVIERAGRMCERRFGPACADMTQPNPKDVLAHFDARRRFEMRQFRTFTDKDRAQLRQDLDRFRSPYYERWYERWRMYGDAATPPAEPARSRQHLGPGVEFVPHLLPFRYPFKSRIEEAV